MPSVITFQPRLASSRQWADLPSDFISKVQEVFAQQFELESLKGEFFVEGRIFPAEIIVRLGYLENGRLKQINFEASMDLPNAEVNADKLADRSDNNSVESKTMSLLYVCIDAVGSLVEEYFDLAEDEEIDVPLSWRPYDFEGEIVYLKHSTYNSRLEEESDKLLGLSDKNLFNEDLASEDALQRAEVDSELALAVQREIRLGRVPHPTPEYDEPREDLLN
jgi:hypothetical protein